MNVEQAEFNTLRQAELRENIAGLVKNLIQAIWKERPGFLNEKALSDWGHSETVLNSNKRAVPNLLGTIISKLEWLSANWNFHVGPQGSLNPFDDDIENQVLDSLHSIFSFDMDDSIIPILESHIAKIKKGKKTNWTELFDLEQLPGLRLILDKLPTSTPVRKVPRWDESTLSLTFDNKLLCTFAHQAKNAILVLRTFESSNWSIDIESPFQPSNLRRQKQGRNKKSMISKVKLIATAIIQTNHTLNKKQNTIQFYAIDRLKIGWKVSK